MIRSFEDSYIHLSALQNDICLVTPEQARSNSIISRSTRIVDDLCKFVFAKFWPGVDGFWGIEDDDAPNAFVDRLNDKSHILLTVGACVLLSDLRSFVESHDWLDDQLRLCSINAASSAHTSRANLGETIQMLGLAALFSHEIGHVVDRHYVPSSAGLDPNSALAEEISADGHAIMAGLRIVDVWADDAANGNPSHKIRLRRLGAVLLVFANSVLDDIHLSGSWDSPDGETHPPGAQRLVSACVHVNDHFEESDSGFGITAFKSVVSGLKAFGI